MTPRLKGKKALVTGGTSGIGKEIAKVYVQNGCDVTIWGTNEQRAKSALEELMSLKIDKSQKIKVSIVDVSDFQKVGSEIESLLKELGSIDILVNNAGITKDNLLLRMTEADFDDVIRVNLKSVYNTCKALYRPMMKAKTGTIINISSVIGLTGNAGQINYAASKSGVIGFTKSLAKELASRGITVNAIAPGYIETKMTDALNEQVKNEILNKIPMKRIGKPSDIAEAALFLAETSYITGQVLTVDGGMVM